MEPRNWQDLKYDESPFFLTEADPDVIGKIYGQIEKGNIGDLAISKHLLPIIKKHGLRLVNVVKKKKHGREFYAGSQDLDSFLWGMFAPLLLIDASFAWHVSGRFDAEKLLQNEYSTYSKQSQRFWEYLSTRLVPCSTEMILEKNCLVVFEHIRRRPFNTGLYFRAGNEAAHDAFYLFATAVAKMHNATK